jgi:hypothetical protein
VNKISKLLLLASFISFQAKAYIPDKCDWLDCEAMANGTDEGGISTFLIVIIIGGIIYLVSK